MKTIKGKLKRIEFLVDQIRDIEQSYNVVKLSSPSQVETHIKAFCVGRKTEVMGVLFLDPKNQVIEQMTNQGTVDHCIVYPREIAKKALLNNATGIIMFHNHPSSDPKPSKADMHITEAVKAAMMTIEVEVLDHIITGLTGSRYSFAEKSML